MTGYGYNLRWNVFSTWKCVSFFNALKNILFIFNSAPKSSKVWSSSGKLNCRGNGSTGAMEAIFFGPQVSSSTKCAGGSHGRLAHARQIHREICALLLGALESLRMNLCEFCTVLPPQWATLTWVFIWKLFLIVL